MRGTTGEAPRCRKKDVEPTPLPLYAWEDTWYTWNIQTCSLPKCRRIIFAACKLYGAPPPTVRQHANKFGYSWSAAGIISMQIDGKNAPTCLHEAAHHIAEHYFGSRIADHGPTHLGIYMWLLRKADVAPVAALHASARKHGLKWRSDVAPSDLRAAQKASR